MTKTVPIARATLGQQVYTEIKRRILHGELRPGERLNETELATGLGVSPTPVREALSKLHRDGLVVYSPWQGATVIDLTPSDVAHLHDIRTALECLAVRGAAANLSGDDFAYLDAILAQAPSAIAAGDPQGLHELNELFHRFFQDRSGNRWLQQMLRSLNDLLILARWPLTAYRSGEEAWQEHARIVAALRTGDLAGAELAMAGHINRVKAELLGRLVVE